MSLRFIIGLCGSGKTEFCINELKTLSAGNSSLIYLAPEHASMQSEKRLAFSAEAKGFMDIQALSFQRLAYRVLSETGGAVGKNLGDTGKIMLLRKVLYELRDKLSYYRGVADKLGFMDELALLVSEFAKYGITTDKIKESCEGLDNRGLKLKLGDICIIIDRFNEIKLEYGVSSDDILDILSDKIELSDLLCGSDIYIDGFNGFTPQEYGVITRLLGVSRRVTVTLTADKHNLELDDGDARDLFHEVKKTYDILRKICVRDRITVEPDMYLTARSGRAKDLKFLTGSLLRQNCSAPPEPVNISVYAANDIYSEVDCCAVGIQRLLFGKNYRYDDISVILCAPDDYAGKIKLAFGRYGIPMFTDAKSDMKQHRAVLFMQKMLETVVSNRSYDSIFGLLKTGLCNISADDTDLIENYILEHGITGKRWLSEFGYANEDDERRLGENAVINDIRLRITGMLSVFSGSFTKFGKYPVRDITEKLYEFMLHCGLPEKLEASVEEFRRLGQNEQAFAEAQIWGKIVELLDKIVEILGDTKATIYEYSKILGAGFASIKLGIVPISLDAVIVGDLTRTLLPLKKAVFILGADSSSFPAFTPNNGLLNDFDRETMNGRFGIELKITGPEKAYGDMFTFATTTAKAKELLCLSYSTHTAKGKDQKRSFVLDDIYRSFGRNFEVSEPAVKGIESVFVKSAVFSTVSANLRENKDYESSVFSGLTRYFSEDAEYSKKIGEARSLTERGEQSAVLSKETVKNLFGEKLKTSVTKLEKYFGCPFSYYVQYVLRAGERKIYEMKSIDIGNCFHSVLEVFTKKLMAAGENGAWRKLGAERLAETAQSSIEEVFDTRLSNFSRITGTEQNLYFKERLKTVSAASINAVTEHLLAGRFELECAEAEFTEYYEKRRDEEPLAAVFGALERKLSDGTRLILEGKIDRVDMLTLDGVDYVKIIDYKSGKKDFDLLEFYYGISLQLILYMNVFIEKYNEKRSISGTNMAHPAAALYFLVKNPIIYADGSFDGDIGEKLLREFKMKGGIVLGDINIVKNLDISLGKDNRKSAVIPIGLTLSKTKNPEDMGFDSFSKQASLQEFQALLDYSVDKAVEAGEGIISGEIPVRPYKSQRGDACRFCLYKGICKFDPLLNRGEYNRLQKMSTDEILDKVNRIVSASARHE